jgi:hypothetical protein
MLSLLILAASFSYFMATGAFQDTEIYEVKSDYNSNTMSDSVDACIGDKIPITMKTYTNYANDYEIWVNTPVSGSDGYYKIHSFTPSIKGNTFDKYLMIDGYGKYSFTITRIRDDGSRSLGHGTSFYVNEGNCGNNPDPNDPDPNDPEPTTGFLEVNSNPTGAEVYIDNIYSGRTPTTTELSGDKNVNIVLKKDGYSDYYQSVYVSNDDTKSVSYTLEEDIQYASLIVNSEPSNANVYIDGSFKGTTPYNVDLIEDSYNIKLTKEGYEDKEVSKYISGTKEIDVTLVEDNGEEDNKDEDYTVEIISGIIGLSVIGYLVRRK